MKKGQALYTLPIWKNGHKLGVMHDIVTAKLVFCAGFRRFLLNSGDADLEEDTRHYFWGALWNHKAERYGSNELGKLQMELRERSRYNYWRCGVCVPDFRPVSVGFPPYVPFRNTPRDIPEDVLLKLEGVSPSEVFRM